MRALGSTTPSAARTPANCGFTPTTLRPGATVGSRRCCPPTPSRSTGGCICSPPDGYTAGTLSQLYGGYIVPGSTLRILHLVVSHWNTTDGSNWPYRAMQYRHNAALRL
jgi:hypothetical protein